jgi:hypothetical protein
MYIIDKKKKDYYDGVVGTMGVDKEIVYERKTIETNKEEEFPKEFQRLKGGSIFCNENHFRNLYFYSPKKESKYDEADAFIVGFCGNLYPGFRFLKRKRINNQYTDSDSFISNIIYNEKKIKKHLENKHWGRILEDDLNYIRNYNAMHIFREYNTPAFIFDLNHDRVSLRINHNDEMFIVNPLLKDYKFYKVFDSFRAFQEIQMFISGVLGIGEKQTIEISDKDKIEQHGYDKKWSFRREPTKKKK